MNVPNRLTFLHFSAPLLSSLMLTGCGQKPAGDDTQNSAATTEVTLTHVVRRNISRTLTLTGSVTAPRNQDVRISAVFSGRVAELPVAEGDRVQSGELIAKIDDRPYQDQLSQAEAAEAQAETNLENAKLSLDRNQNLVDRGIAARKNFEDATTQANVAAASVKKANAALELAAARRAVNSKIESAYFDLESRRLQFQLYSETVVLTSRHLEDVAEDSYKSGKSNILTVLNAQSNVQQAQADYLASLLSMQASFSQLGHSVGAPMD